MATSKVRIPEMQVVRLRSFAAANHFAEDDNSYGEKG